MKTLYNLELMRHGVTPAQFLAYCRSQCKKHWISWDMDTRYFADGEKHSFGYLDSHYDGGTPSTRPAVAETCKALPYDHQTYIRNFDGSVYNEIVEFTFDDERTGTGYFYIVNTESDTAEDTEKEAQSIARYHAIQIEHNARQIEKGRASITETESNAAHGWTDQQWAAGHIETLRREIESLEHANAEHAAAIAEMTGDQDSPDTETDTDTETTAEKKEDEAMTTTNNTTTAAAKTFPRLLSEINANYDRLTADTFHYIRLGWFPSWANEHHNDPDRGLKQYSTARRWEQYKAGEITREKAIELAERRAVNEIEKSRTGKIASLEAAANAPRISSASVTVEWSKSRTWGANPTAELLNMGDGRTVGHASGCGYDKESAAIAEAMNASPAALRVLYELGEAALKRGESPRSASACSGYHWGGCIGYGAGYSVLPYWEGGVGSSCFWDILKKAGYTVRHAGSGKMFDCYTFYAT